MSEKARQQKSPKQIRDPVLYEFPSPPCKELSAATMPNVPQGKVVRNWKEFKTLEDWKREFDSHPEWRGRSTSQMQRDKYSGARSFYAAFSIWCDNEAKGDNSLRKSLIQLIFPPKQMDWSNFKSIEDWRREFDSHLEWKDRSRSQMAQDKDSGASAFYGAFSTWANLEANGDKLLKQSIIEKIFPRRNRDWSNLQSIEDWKREFDSHPGWKGRSIDQMIKDIASGAQAFEASFRIWCCNEAKGDSSLRKSLVQQIFPPRQKNWSHLGSIEDWKKEFDSHPEWKGRHIVQMQRDQDSGAPAFYAAFSKWADLEAKGDRVLKRRIIEQLFSRLRKDWSSFKSIDDWKKEFDSHTEWKGRSIVQMQRDKDSGAIAFYTAFDKWAGLEAKGDKVLRQRLVEQLLPRIRKDRSNLKSIEDWKREFDSHPEWKYRSITQMQRDRNSGAQSFYAAFSKWTDLEAKGDKILRRQLRVQLFPQRKKDWSYLKSIDDWKKEFDLCPEWKGRSSWHMDKDRVSGAGAFYGAFKAWSYREANGDIALSTALISRVMPYTRNAILQDLLSLSFHISVSPDAKTFQDILSSLPLNPSNQNLSQVIRIENEEFKVYHVMFNNAGKIEGRWMIHRADAPKLVAAFGGLMPDTSPRDDASVLSVLEY